MEQAPSFGPAGRSSASAERALNFTPTGVALIRGVAPTNTDNLWRALFEFYELLRLEQNAEAVYQAYFERNPIVFQVLGFDTFASFEKSSGNNLPFDPERNFRPEPDFLCAKTGSGEVTVFELKTPFVGNLITTRRTDGNRAKLREDAARHVAQAREYAASIKGSVEARSLIRDVLQLERIADYRITMVYGLAQENDAARINEILSGATPPTSFLHYDQVLDRLAQAYAAKHEGVVSRPGWCFVYQISFPEIQPSARVFISDSGCLDGERISLVREGELIAFECVDANGHLHRLTGQCAGGRPHYVHFEFSNDENGLYMSLRIDDEEQALARGKSRFRCDPDISNLILGADLSGRNGAEMNIFQIIFVKKTLSLEDKLGLYGKTQEKELSSYLHFETHSFMRNIPEGALIQEADGFKPTHMPGGQKVGRINSLGPRLDPKLWSTDPVCS